MMKKLFAIIISAIFVLSIPAAFSAFAEEQAETAISSVKISESLNKVEINCSVSASTASSYDKLYLLRSLLSADSTKFNEPVGSADTTAGNIKFECDFDRNNTADLLSGYMIAVKTEDGYAKLSDIKYIDNPEILSHNDKEYPTIISKKGLSVQYVYDAQSLGVKHTVVDADIARILDTGNDENNVMRFTQNGEIFTVNKSEIAELDYKIRALTDAGIHVYLDLILSYNDKINIYPQGAESTNSVLFQPNIENSLTAKNIYALLSFLSDRYSSDSGEFGFCGSYIIGSDVTDKASNFNGYNDDENYIKSYSEYLRLCHISLKSGYKFARCFVSVSGALENDDQPASGSDTIAIKKFLTALNSYSRDIPYNVAVNPCFDDSASQSDEGAVQNSGDYAITINNISDLTDFLCDDAMLYNDIVRKVAITKFAFSGKIGDASEKKQAADFLKAFYDISKNDIIESAIWSHHVDRKDDGELYFGLYSSSDISLSANETKIIYDAFAAVDDRNADISDILRSLSGYLPKSEADEICKYYLEKGNKSRTVIYENQRKKTDNKYLISKLKLDFSENLYDFYPSVNSKYIELHSENGDKYMRMSLENVSYFEYMGGSYDIESASVLSECDTLAIRVRLVSNDKNGKIRIVLSGYKNGIETVINCDADIKTNELVSLIFDISDFSENGIDNCKISILGLTEKYGSSDVFLDVSYVDFCDYEETHLPITFLAAIITFSVVIIVLLVYVLSKNHKHSEQ